MPIEGSDRLHGRVSVVRPSTLHLKGGWGRSGPRKEGKIGSTQSHHAARNPRSLTRDNQPSPSPCVLRPFYTFFGRLALLSPEGRQLHALLRHPSTPEHLTSPYDPVNRNPRSTLPPLHDRIVHHSHPQLPLLSPLRHPPRRHRFPLFTPFPDPFWLPTASSTRRQRRRGLRITPTRITRLSRRTDRRPPTRIANKRRDTTRRRGILDLEIK